MNYDTYAYALDSERKQFCQLKLRMIYHIIKQNNSTGITMYIITTTIQFMIMHNTVKQFHYNIRLFLINIVQYLRHKYHSCE